MSTTNNDLLEFIEIDGGTPNASRDKAASVIWLHGLGADGNDFVPIVNELDLPAVPIRFVFPHAPKIPVTINGGYVMRAWYDIVNTDLVRREDESGVRGSQRRVEALIARERARGVAANRIVLAGFSQGGAIALQTALRQTEPFAGVMALSTYLPLADKLASEGAIASRAVPILFAHGTQDPVVTIARAKTSRDQLEQAGYTVLWREYPMQHSVCAEEVADIGAWLSRILA